MNWRGLLAAALIIAAAAVYWFTLPDDGCDKVVYRYVDVPTEDPKIWYVMTELGRQCPDGSVIWTGTGQMELKQ